MNAAEHKAEAERLAEMAGDYPSTGDDYAHEHYLLAKAQVHATLATLPDPAPVDPPADPLWDAPLYKAAALLGRVAIGDEGQQRERTIAYLMLGQARHAADIAVHALHAARDAGDGHKVKAVEAAIATLGISTDAD